MTKLRYESKRRKRAKFGAGSSLYTEQIREQMADAAGDDESLWRSHGAGPGASYSNPITVGSVKLPGFGYRDDGTGGSGVDRVYVPPPLPAYVRPAHGRVGAGKDAQDAQVAADRAAAAAVQAAMRPTAGPTSGWNAMNSYTVGTNPFNFGDRTPASAVWGAITTNPFTTVISGGTATPRGGSNMFAKPVNMWANEGAVDTILHNRFTLGDADRQWSRNMPKRLRVYGLDAGWQNAGGSMDPDKKRVLVDRQHDKYFRHEEKVRAKSDAAAARTLAKQAAAEARKAKSEEWSTPADAVHWGLVKVIGNNMVTRYSKKVLKMAENMALGYFLAGALPAGALFGAGAAFSSSLSEHARIVGPMDALDESYELDGVHVGGGAVMIKDGPLRTIDSAFHDLADATAALRRARRGDGGMLLLEDAPVNLFETASKTGTVQERTADINAALKREREMVPYDSEFLPRTRFSDPGWAAWIAEGFMHA